MMRVNYVGIIENEHITSGREYLIKYLGYSDSDEIMGARMVQPEFHPNYLNRDGYADAVDKLEKSNMCVDAYRKKFREFVNEKISKLRGDYQRMTCANQRIKRIMEDIETWEAPTPEHQAVKEQALFDLKMSLYPDELVTAVKDFLKKTVCCEENLEDLYRYIYVVKKNLRQDVDRFDELCKKDIEAQRADWQFKKDFFESIKGM